MSTPDVLICGAGPVGLTLAAQLLRQGLTVRIIDRDERRTSLSKALVVWSRSLELLDMALDAEQFQSAGLPVRRAEFRTGQEVIAEIDLTGADSPWGTGVMLPQSETERILEEHLQKRGVVVERQTTLQQFADLGDRVRAVLQRPDGTLETVETPWLAGCDGAHSVVRHGLNLPFHGEVDLHRWLLADAHIAGPAPEAEVVVCWHRAGAFIMFRIDRDRWRVIAEQPLTDPDLPRQDPTLAEMQTLLDERGPSGLRLHDPVWLAEFRINERKVDKYRVGRVLLAGDAAHVHSPAGGQGMNTGMQDACNLAWKLALAHRGLASEATLESYTAERSAIGEQVLHAASRVTNIATLKNPIAQTFRNAFARIALHFTWTQEHARDLLSELAIRYSDSTLNGRDGRASRIHPRPGERVPDAPLTTVDGQATSLYRELRAPRIKIVAWGGAADTAETIIAAAPAEWRTQLQPLNLTACAAADADPLNTRVCDAQAAERIGLAEPGFLIIRPDGYLAAAGKLDHVGLLTQWLEQLASTEKQPAKHEHFGACCRS